ncbi:hypothetical protein JOB18_048074 [Solea senegalensis]|uniref:Uncharacterized protein n=1 Tax=Solea senegalensis TaxID=28829 RepID=A0AAV6SHR8_SOLSE|nr:hypothetical protein JOB18_048074 [Solea senegalensis]
MPPVESKELQLNTQSEETSAITVLHDGSTELCVLAAVLRCITKPVLSACPIVLRTSKASRPRQTGKKRIRIERVCGFLRLPMQGPDV